ncbi:MAG TPA: hypothetical protein VGL10_06120 [Gammaproteobacteria bacterium]
MRAIVSINSREFKSSKSFFQLIFCIGGLSLVACSSGGGGGDSDDEDEDYYRVAQVSASSGDHTCARLENGRVKCWGYNSHGQLGLGDFATRGNASGDMGNELPMVNLGSGRTAVSIVTGQTHTCVVLDNDELKCWGSNDAGKLGLGDTVDRGDDLNEMGDDLPAVDLGTNRTAVQVTAGQYHTCARLDNAQVKCWGWNDEGQLGIGDDDRRGDGPGEMGNNLPAIDLGTGRTAAQIAAGHDHTCAILDNGTVKCWGANWGGQLGYGNIVNRGDNPGEMGDSLPAVDLGSGRTAVAIDGGYGYTCALLDNDQIKCWGDNDAGQLGLGDTDRRGNGPGEMGDDLPTIDLGAGRTVVAFTAGIHHVCARLDNNRLKCWGYNANYGSLGLGDMDNRGDDADEMGDNLPFVNLGSGRTVRAVTAGMIHTCALLDNDKVKCWGHGADGELGLGDLDNRGDDPGEMGDELPAVNLGAP